MQNISKKNVTDALHKGSPAAPFTSWIVRTANRLLPLLKRVRLYEGDSLPLHLAAPVRQMARTAIAALPRSLGIKLPVATPTSSHGIPRAVTITTKVCMFYLVHFSLSPSNNCLLR